MGAGVVPPPPPPQDVQAKIASSAAASSGNVLLFLPAILSIVAASINHAASHGRYVCGALSGGALNGLNMGGAAVRD